MSEGLALIALSLASLVALLCLRRCKQSIMPCANCESLIESQMGRGIPVDVVCTHTTSVRVPRVARRSA